MSRNFYTTSEYTMANPSYHAEDSWHKWKNFRRLLDEAVSRDAIDPLSIYSLAEIGCGRGHILRYAAQTGLLPSCQVFEGWDINPDVLSNSSSSSPPITFIHGDMLSSKRSYDLVLCADVIEHVQDFYEFLADLKSRATFFIFNVPLEHNLLTSLQGPKALRYSYNQVGHLHFFTEASISLALESTGYKIVASRFADNRLSTRPTSLRNLVASIAHVCLRNISPSLCASMIGDSLVILAKA